MCFNFRVLRLPYNIFSRKEHNLGLERDFCLPLV